MIDVMPALGNELKIRKVLIKQIYRDLNRCNKIYSKGLANIDRDH